MKFSKKSTLPILAAVSALLVCLCLGGATLAFLSDKTGTKQNRFDKGTASIDIEENSDPTPEPTKVIPTDNNGAVKQVAIRNTGDTAVYIRVRLIPGWKAANGTAAAGPLRFGPPNTLNGNTLTAGDVRLELAAAWASGWLYDPADDTFYYTEPVAPGASTTRLLERVRIADAAKATKEAWAGLQVEVLSDAVQAEAGAVGTAWPAVQRDANGTLSLKNG